MSKAFVGQVAPDFSGIAVQNGEFHDLVPESFKKLNRFVILLFYPMDFTFVCPTEILAFDERLDEFKALNCDVIGVSCDSQFCHLAWAKTPRKEGGLEGLRMPLLADKTASIAKSYGVYLEDKGVTLRGLFIIDGKGILRQIIVNDLPVGRGVDEALRLVQAIQYVDEHGEVCPAGWKPGKKTMIADPIKSKEYFNAVN